MVKHIHPTCDGQKVVYIAKIHWHWDVVLSEINNGVHDPWNHLLCREKYSKILNYTGNEEVYQGNKLFFAPNMTIADMQIKIEQLRQDMALKSILESKLQCLDTGLSRRVAKYVQNEVNAHKIKTATKNLDTFKLLRLSTLRL